MEQTQRSRPHLSRLVTVVCVVLWLSMQAAPGSAAPAPGAIPNHEAAERLGPRLVDRVFDLRALSAPQRDVVHQVLSSFDFDWRQLSLADLGDRRRRIVVEVADISAWSAAGLAWPAPIGKIQIDDQVFDLEWFQQVFIHELTHIVDFFYLVPNDLHDDVADLYGVGQWSELGHPFIPAFVRAFSSFDPTEDVLPSSLDADLRSLMGGRGEPPAKSVSLSVDHRSLIDVQRPEVAS